MNEDLREQSDSMDENKREETPEGNPMRQDGTANEQGNDPSGRMRTRHRISRVERIEPRSAGNNGYRQKENFTPRQRNYGQSGGYGRYGNRNGQPQGYDSRQNGYAEGGYERPYPSRRGETYTTKSFKYNGSYREDQRTGKRYYGRTYSEKATYPFYHRDYEKQGAYGNDQRQGYNPKNGYNQNGYRYNQQNRHNPERKVLRYAEANVDPNTPIRLNRYLANAGVCSRRAADTHIVAGDVTVNGKVVTELGSKVLRSDDVRFKDVKVSLEAKIYLILNKPRGYVTTIEDPENRKTVMDLVRGACPERIYPVGRLDRNTTGVLLFTNDGELASKLMHPQYLKKKIYHVFLDHEVTEEDLRRATAGITLEDGEIKADAIAWAKDDDHTQVGVEIHSGRNRIVRRLFDALGYRVVKLDRVYFAGLTKKRLRRGTWRFLTQQEVDMLRMGAYE